MTLSLRDRLILPSILPTEGSFTKIVIKNDILDKVKITQEEITEFEIKSNEENNSVNWNQTKEKPLDVSFSGLESNLIKECLENLSNEEKLNDETFSLYKLFNNK